MLFNQIGNTRIGHRLNLGYFQTRLATCVPESVDVTTGMGLVTINRKSQLHRSEMEGI